MHLKHSSIRCVRRRPVAPRPPACSCFACCSSSARPRCVSSCRPLGPSCAATLCPGDSWWAHSPVRRPLSHGAIILRLQTASQHRPPGLCFTAACCYKQIPSRKTFPALLGLAANPTPLCPSPRQPSGRAYRRLLVQFLRAPIGIIRSGLSLGRDSLAAATLVPQLPPRLLDRAAAKAHFALS